MAPDAHSTSLPGYLPCRRSRTSTGRTGCVLAVARLIELHREVPRHPEVGHQAVTMVFYLIGELDANNLGYSKDLSEVDLSDPEDVKITVEDAAGALVVHLGASDFLERYRIYIRHIQDWRQQFKKLDSVDLRYDGQIIVNPDSPQETTKKSLTAEARRQHGGKRWR